MKPVVKKIKEWIKKDGLSHLVLLLLLAFVWLLPGASSREAKAMKVKTDTATSFKK